MKHILCFGDSNTHGFIPGGGRYDDNTRWTCQLANLLGADYCIHEEGLNGRTSSFDDPMEPYKNAMDYIVPCLHTHAPLDLILVMLGSNDMKHRFSPSATKIADSIYRLTKLIQEESTAPILLVSPIHLGKDIATSAFGVSFHSDAIAISHELGSCYKEVAKTLGVHFMDAAEYASPSAEDSLHLTKEGHTALANAFCEKIKSIL